MLLFAQATSGSSSQLPPDYAQFLGVIGALLKLVVLSMLLERGLAVIFEHEWFIRLTTKNNREKRFSGLKGILALAAAMGVCFWYCFDVVGVVFGKPEPTW